jgi:hypothetical protein
MGTHKLYRSILGTPDISIYVIRCKNRTYTIIYHDGAQYVVDRSGNITAFEEGRPKNAEVESAIEIYRPNNAHDIVAMVPSTLADKVAPGYLTTMCIFETMFLYHNIKLGTRTSYICEGADMRDYATFVSKHDTIDIGRIISRSRKTFISVPRAFSDIDFLF